MRVDRIGFTALKGAAHSEHDQVELAVGGPVGDRLFCLLDPGQDRVLRTVENPWFLTAAAQWDGTTLSLQHRDGLLKGPAEGTGDFRYVDYWGRRVEVEILHGPWAAPYRRRLGRPVELVRSTVPSALVYGAPVSLVSSSSLSTLAEASGVPVTELAVRLRMTFTVDTPGLPAHVEDDWVGAELTLGDARVAVTSTIPRCAVINLNPATGLPDRPVLTALARYRRTDAAVPLGVDAVVTCPGTVRRGDPVRAG
ncbi:hypothetical protein GCM10009841_25630 [Microlunatus panaciterrae]|uniref:Uncharacterized protein YcbX n=1 Tax=Microlunatus panaciterrae TaxID=400768 RepID=A0ABS2REL5_9ACTN|nr:MOSC domain-containing protein [Microlunatus panaciterrae]MBM7797445.1 uncharacterized protein YcbX [Microlunatus panaciterrae]